MPGDNESKTAIALVDPLVGTVFDKRFKVEERIAAGGFGAIYRAKHVKSGHPIALKVLLPSLAQDLGVVARFRREGSALTSLRNPHTIAAYELGQATDRTLFIVMELLHGQNLFERYQQQGPFEWKRAVKIAREVCESLEEAHALGIVHRDLKPTNIHLEQHGDDPDYVKVLDFGIAKILRGSELDAADITNAGQMIGTLDYMSPEQMVGGTITGQCDIYTLGIVMYEMIAGTLPFPEAENAAAALKAVLKTTPKRLSAHRPIPDALDRLVMRCLAREARNRYHSVTELKTALDRLLAGAGDEATQTTPVDLVTQDDDSTRITPPPEKLQLLETSRTPVIERRTPPPEAMRTPPLERRTPPPERRKATPAAEWTDDDEQAPTTTRLPDGYDAPPARRRPTSTPEQDPEATVAGHARAERFGGPPPRRGDPEPAARDSSPTTALPATPRDRFDVAPTTARRPEELAASPRGDRFEVAPTTARRPEELAASSGGRGDRFDVAPTTTRRPDELAESARDRFDIAPTPTRKPDELPAAARNADDKAPPAKPIAIPTPRPLASRRAEQPVPQLVVAPFSSTPRAPGYSTPVPGTATVPQSLQPSSPQTPYPLQSSPQTPYPVQPSSPQTPYPPQAPFAPSPQTPYPSQSPYSSTPFPPPQTPFSATPFPPQQTPFAAAPPTPGAVGVQTGPHAAQSGPFAVQTGPFLPSLPSTPAQYDMGRIAAREATVRKVIWVVVLVLGTAVGFLIAMRF